MNKLTSQEVWERMLKGSSKDVYLPPRVMELFQVPGEMMVRPPRNLTAFGNAEIW